MTEIIQRGTLLLSEPFLADENFVRSVVLICEHNEQGSFGLVLNKETTFQLTDVSEVNLNLPISLFVGGPVEINTLHFLHANGEGISGGIPIADGLIWGGDFDQMRTNMLSGKLDESQIRYFIGYSGWDTGQLESELDEKAWIIYNRNLDNILQIEHHKLWRTLMNELGGTYKEMANYPLDPSMN